MNDLMRRLLFLPEQATLYSVKADHLHFFVISTTLIASTAVGLTSLFFFVRYRRRSEHQKTPRISPTVAIEALFIGVPLSFFLVWFFIGFHDYVEQTTPPANALDVYVMAKQWMWKFSYPDGPNGLDALHVPAGRPIRLLITSRDVVHSFYVPAFRLKKDAVPGRYQEIWFQATQPGHYQVLCAEYCGMNHSAMRAEVHVLPPQEFDAWLQSERRGLASRQDDAPVGDHHAVDGSDITARGKQAALDYGCAKCHSVDGSPHIGPTWLDLYMRREQLTDGRTIIADEGYLTESMMDPRAKIVAGFNPVMPTFQGRLDNADAAALVEYIKSLRSDRAHRITSEAPRYEPIP
jgi:cytochrome c oxidase subunit II